MSSILRALKKLNEEKRAGTAGHTPINTEMLLTGEVLRRSPLMLVVSYCFVLALGSGTTYLIVKHQTKSGGTAAGKPSPPTPPQTQTSFTAFTSLGIPTAAPGVSEVNLAPLQNFSHSIPVPDQPRSQPPLIEVSHPAPPPEIVPHPSSSPVPSDTRTVTGESVKEVPILKVDGIAFEKNSAPMAIINGTPVTSGSVIQGVRIEEIQTDVVVFSLRGETFEVPLGKSNR